MNTLRSEIEKADAAYGGEPMPAHNKAVLRAMIAREEKWWGEKCERDYVYGQDEGEPPAGASWYDREKQIRS